MSAPNSLLTVLSNAERAALYEQPDFDNEQRFEYLTLTNDELGIALSRKSLSAKVHCILQIGYFKAVKLFFRVSWEQINHDDANFIIQQYFSEKNIEDFEVITKHEYYTQCNLIVMFFGYCMWNGSSGRTHINVNSEFNYYILRLNIMVLVNLSKINEGFSNTIIVHFLTFNLYA